ncbi:MobP3 family relaxase [Clostridium estertheticum]|uniref:MobP3 family relaxase n=1 Tax=Clostridium estertheticum TaxID=238834 RepID=UPI001C0AE22B|nr:MobP3 family relaxase [Clostridium estertheticum]MBU3173267.1 hypothetical protein [Clostridium estertheticum]
MSKVIFKMSFKHPNRTSTTGKNVSHVKYIATRPGVDKTITKADLKTELEKGVENLSSNNEGYAKYIGERPNSHGLFGKDGIEDPLLVQEEVGQVDSFVWRAIVSLKEEDAKDLEYTKKDEWQNMLRTKVPDMAEKMGIRPANLRWVAAVHMEKGHPHSHIMFWEVKPERTIGIVKAKTLDDIRKMYTDEIFAEQRLGLLSEKDIMRDLIGDLAKGDISKATVLIKDVKAVENELTNVTNETDPIGIQPRLYTEEEQELSIMIKKLGEMLPGKGRVALKYMPENVKEEVGIIADYLLKQPLLAVSLEKNLKAVEELTKMYTGKEEDIKKAIDNAYKDMRDRVSQLVLKGAAESQRKNLFYVDQELSEKAVTFIKNITSKIDVIPEQTKVINEISLALVRTGYNDEEITKNLLEFTERENINFPRESIDNLIKQIRESGTDNQDVNILSSQKKVDYYLSVLKLVGCDEEEAFNSIKDTIKKDSQELDNKMQQLKGEGILKESEGKYVMTNKGIDEFLKVKELDGAEKAILKMLENDGDIIPKAGFREMLNNKDIFSSLQNKDPDEFKLGNYDARIRGEFGKNNTLTLKQLEDNIYEKYTDEDFNTNTDKADTEIEMIEKRIEKLSINGHVKFDKKSEIYEFTEELNSCFQYDKEKEAYFYTKEALEKLKIKSMEFTLYDAKVTLGYIDKAENKVLSEAELKDTLLKETVNQTAIQNFEKFNSILESGQGDKYINIGENGEIISTEEGKALGLELSRLNKYFYEGKGAFTEDSLKEMFYKEHGSEYEEKQFSNVSNNLNSQIEKGNILKDDETGDLLINKESLESSIEIQRLNNRYFKFGPVTEDKIKENIKVSSQVYADKKIKAMGEDIKEAIEKDNIKKNEETGALTINKESLSLSFDLKKLNKYFSGAGLSLTAEKLKDVCIKEFGEENGDKQYENIIKQINKQIDKGNIEKNSETGAMTFTVKGTFLADNLQKINRYLYNAEEPVTEENLKVTISNEFNNDYQDKQFTKIIEQINKHIEKGNINKDPETLELKLSDNGNLLSELQKINRYFKNEETLTEKEFKVLINENTQNFVDKQYDSVVEKLKIQVKLGHVDFDKEKGFTLNPLANDISRLLYQVYKEVKVGGKVTKENFKAVLEKNIPNKQAANQLKYLMKRLDNLKAEGFLDKGDKGYSLNISGIQKREDILVPQRDLLRGKIDYLQKLGFLENTIEGYQATPKYYNHMKNIALSKEEKTSRTSDIISKDMATIIDRTQDKVDVGKIERFNQKITAGKYINGEFEEVKTDYESVRASCGVHDTTKKTLHHLSTTLIVSGLDVDMTKGVIKEWNEKSESNLEESEIDEIVENAYEAVEEDKRWGNTTLISTKDWKETFKNLGIDEKDVPTWIYKGENWEKFNSGMGLASLVNDVWKAAWKELEKQRMQAQGQASYMKKQLNKQQAASASKEAIYQQIKKSKSKGLYHEDDFEM